MLQHKLINKFVLGFFPPLKARRLLSGSFQTWLLVSFKRSGNTDPWSLQRT